MGVYKPIAGESFKLVFRGTDGQSSFDITMTIAAFIQSDTQANSQPISEQQCESGTAVEGWIFATNPIGADIFVNSPGAYEVYLDSGRDTQYLGNISLVHLQTPPYSAEEITAIKSDPLALKFVKMEVKCKLCDTALRAYTGVERSPSLEGQGYRWSQEIDEDEFLCPCSKTRFSLTPIRTGLHGLLRRHLNPHADTAISSVRLYENAVLEQSSRQLLKLIDEDTSEEAVQKFLESHPIFFHIFVPKKVILKPPILTKYFADFAVLNERNELLLIEIERPGMRLLKKDGDITAGLAHAFYQVRSWVQILNDRRDAALDAVGLGLDEVAKVKGVVIAGRRPTDERQLKLLRSVSTSEIELYTYDDILKAVTELIRRVATV